MILYKLIPAKARPYAKTVVASAGLVLTGVVATFDAPRWASVGVALLTALGVYGQPNAQPDEADNADG